MDKELLREINEVYQMTGNLHKTAKELGFAYAKVRKALITYGTYSTQFSDDVYRLRCNGYTVEEIAKELDTTVKRVSAWLPYEKSMYNLPKKTKDAVRSGNYRKRNELARENSVLAKHIFNDDDNDYADEDERSAKMQTRKTSNANSAEKESINTITTGEPIRLHLKLHEEELDEDGHGQVAERFFEGKATREAQDEVMESLRALERISQDQEE